MRRFSCTQCHFESLAKVRAQGQGESTSMLWLREEGAKTDAQNEAVRNAEEAADQMAALGECPACGHRDESAVSGVKNGARFAGAAMGLFFGGVVWFFFKGQLGVFAGLLTLVITALWHTSTKSWMWDANRVEVLGHDELLTLMKKHGLDRAEADEEELAEA